MSRAAPRLIETVRVRNGVAPLWYLHLRRLATSCQALGVPLPRDLPTPVGGADRVHRLEVGPHGATLSERPVGSVAPLRVIVSRVPHQLYPHKTTDRAQFDEALAEARAAGADDAILLAPGAGYVAEGANWGLFWWEGADDRLRLCAPPLDLGILPGVARARIAELAPIVERRVSVDALAGRPVFAANAARGIVPIASISGQIVPPHASTEALAARFWP